MNANAKRTPDAFILARIARQVAERKQLEGIESSEIFKATVESKLISAGACGKWFVNFLRCGNEPIFIGCFGCGKITPKTYRCNLKWCPCCNWRSVERKKELLSVITNGMTNVKHVVLTQRNYSDLTKATLAKDSDNLLKLRRRRITSRVFGGCASQEFTNEENGWHVHWHLLLHTKFLCQNCLAWEWGQLCGQKFAIVKVLSVDESSYLKEVCKYVVTGSELAKWKPAEILEFVTTIQGTRQFRVFGTFKKVRELAEQEIRDRRPPKPACDCGSSKCFAAPTEKEADRIYASQFE